MGGRREQRKEDQVTQWNLVKSHPNCTSHRSPASSLPCYGADVSHSCVVCKCLLKMTER